MMRDQGIEVHDYKPSDIGLTDAAAHKPSRVLEEAQARWKEKAKRHRQSRDQRRDYQRPKRAERRRRLMKEAVEVFDGKKLTVE